MKAECNTSAPVGSDYYEGYFSRDDLKIVIPRGGFLSIQFAVGCTEQGCLFQPAIVNKTSQHGLYFANNDGIMETELSLLFSATINKAESVSEDEEGISAAAIAVPVLILLLLLTTAVVVGAIVITRRQAKKRHSSHRAVLQVDPTVNIVPTSFTETGNSESYNAYVGGPELPSRAELADSKEGKDSFAYDYARDFDAENGIKHLPAIPEGHYEIDMSPNEEPFWEPASVEDDLKSQLQDLSLSQDTLS
jgi:hypothetical protein